MNDGNLPPEEILVTPVAASADFANPTPAADPNKADTLPSDAADPVSLADQDQKNPTSASTGSPPPATSSTEEQPTNAPLSPTETTDQTATESNGNGEIASEPQLDSQPAEESASSVHAQMDNGAAPAAEVSTASSSFVTPSVGAVTSAGPGDNESSSSSTSKPRGTPTRQLKDLKLKLFSKLASVDRGIAANFQDTQQVEDIVQQLEGVGGSVQLSWGTGTMSELFGSWRLLYSSGFNSGSLGGTRPGPPAAFVPLVLGQVYQRIDNAQGFLDNIVEFMFNYNLPKLPFVSGDPESPAVRLTLRHTFEVMGSNTVEIVYEDTSAELVGSSLFISLPKFDLPSPPDFLKPPKFIRSAKFDVTYLDSEVRITRGDRGELRIYLKDHTAELPFSDYDD